MSRPLAKSAYQNYFFYFSTKTYVVGAQIQKNRLNETVLLSIQNIYVKTDGLENIFLILRS